MVRSNDLDGIVEIDAFCLNLCGPDMGKVLLQALLSYLRRIRTPVPFQVSGAVMWSTLAFTSIIIEEDNESEASHLCPTFYPHLSLSCA